MKLVHLVVFIIKKSIKTRSEMSIFVFYYTLYFSKPRPAAKTATHLQKFELKMALHSKK
jgi:hypothetical protein